MGRDFIKNLLKSFRRLGETAKVSLFFLLIFLLTFASAFVFYRRNQTSQIPTTRDDIVIDRINADPSSTSAQVATPAGMVRSPGQKVAPKTGFTTQAKAKGKIVQKKVMKKPANTTPRPAYMVDQVPTQKALPARSKGVAKVKPAGRTIHVVKSGDTLSKISAKHYNNPGKWRSIYSANQKTIGSNPHLIYPNQQLTIPRK